MRNEQFFFNFTNNVACYGFIIRLCIRLVSTLNLILLLLFSLLPQAQADEALTPVTLQLQWNHQFQFAGYYAAKTQGFYRQAGLDVTIKDGGYDEHGLAVQPEEEVLFNRAQFGITRTDLLINRSNGLPLVVLANIMQHSPLIFLTTEEYGFKRLEDIGYQRPISLNINTLGDNRIDAEAVAALKISGIELDQLNNSTPSWNLDDLIRGQTQLTPAYSSDEPYFIRKQGKTPVSIKPISYGIDFYGDLLFTSQNMLEQQPDVVRKFRAASIKGWQYALSNQEAVVDTIIKHYKTRNSDYDRDFLLYEAGKMAELISPEIIEIGYINPQRWLKIAQTYQSLGLIKSIDLQGFLYDSADIDIWALYKTWILLALIILTISTLVILYFFFLVNNLNKEIDKRHLAESKLKILAQLDGLTGIDNRYMFERNLEREFDRARRNQLVLSMLMIDIDDFKQINDQYGHLAGDEVLRSFVKQSKEVLRHSDIFARYGGEEFVVLMPDTQTKDAILVAQRILHNSSSNTIVFEGAAFNYTVSIGASEIAESDLIGRDLLLRSDRLLYQAKQSGKNQVKH